MGDGLLMDQTVYDGLSEIKKPVFVFTWLTTLEGALPHAEKNVIKECQEDLVQQLLTQLGRSPGSSTQKLIGRCLSKLIMTGDSLLLYTSVNTCNSMLRARDDVASTINGRLAAITCLGTIYKSMGMAIGRYFEDSVVLMAKLVKQSESQVRYETMHAFCGLLEGLGSAASVCFKEINKAAKSCMTDRAMCVRAAAAECLISLVNCYHSLHQNEVESITSLCFRCMDGSNYSVRLQAACLLGHLMVKTQSENIIGSGRAAATTGSAKSIVVEQQVTGTGYKTDRLSVSWHTTLHCVRCCRLMIQLAIREKGVAVTNASGQKPLTFENVLSLLASGFLRGPGGFLMGSTASDMIKGTSTVNRKVRVGVTYAYIEFVTMMGSQWFVAHLATIIAHCTGLLANSRATPTQAEANFTRLCIGYLLTRLYRRLLSESAQLTAASHVISLLRQNLQQFPAPTPTPASQEEAACDIGPFVTDLRTCSTETTSDDRDDGPGDWWPSEGSAYSRPPVELPTLTGGGGLIRTGFGKSSLARTQRLQQQQKQHVIICLFDQLTQLIAWLDSLAAPLLEAPSGLVDLLMTTVSHSSAPIRLASASCLRQLATALTNHRFHLHLLDRCIAGLQHAQRSHPDAILGYSAAIAAILPVVNQNNSGGLPSSKAKQIFSLADELLRAANQNSRLTLSHTQSGWLLIGTCMTLGPTELIKTHLPRILQFWRNAFPRSARELEAERQRGDAFTWQVMLEARAGALCSMQTFLECCPSLLATEDDIHRLLPPVECAMSMLGHLVDIVRIYGSHLKVTACLIRHRLYRVLSLLPPLVYKSCYDILLRELVADFTLTDSLANTTTTLLHTLCSPEENIALLDPGSSIQDTDHHLLEQQLQPFGGSLLSSHLDQDPAHLFLHNPMTSTLANDPPDLVEQLLSGLDNPDNLLTAASPPGAPLVDHQALPSLNHSAFGGVTQKSVSASFHLFDTGPPPIIVSVVDSSIELFARIFPFTIARHCVQIVDHFANCIRLTKSTHREAVQLNVFVALLGALRRLEIKTPLAAYPELLKSTATLIFSAIRSPCVPLRCISSECLGRLAQVTGDSDFLSTLIQQTLHSLRTVRQPTERAGYCHAFGCLHRYVGGLGTGQHLGSSVGALLTVAQDSSTPEVQVWALHALTLVADAGGPLFRDYVEPCLELVSQFLLKLNSTTVEIQRNLGRLLTALITTTGPELQGVGVSIMASRQTYLLCCSILQASTDPLSQAESVNCVQRIYMFAPQLALSVTGLIPRLQGYLTSSHMALRRSAIIYLRQLSQKSASQLYSQLSTDAMETGASDAGAGLEEQLFHLLDVETDLQMRRDVEEIILNLVQATTSSRLSHWLHTAKVVLQTGSSEKQCTSEFAASTNSQRVSTSHEYTRSRKTMGRNPFNTKDTIDLVHESFHRKCEEEEGGQAQTTGARAIGPEASDSDGDADTTLGGPRKEVLEHTDTSSPPMLPRWSTRVFAVGCLRLIISTCVRQAKVSALVVSTSVTLQSDDCTGQSTSSGAANDADFTAHFDLEKARHLCSLQPSTGVDVRNWLVLHLGDLIQMAFMSATSESQQLRAAGLSLMRDVIFRFAPVPDPDCLGDRLLDQYRAQVSAALRPTFSASPSPMDATSPEPTDTFVYSNTSPEVTAVAYYVCSAWISSGVSQTPRDLHRFGEMLHQAFHTLFPHPAESGARTQSGIQDQRWAGPLPSSSGPVHRCSVGDGAVTVQVLAFLRACADIYLVSVQPTTTAGHQLGQFASLTGVNGAFDLGDEVDTQSVPTDKQSDLGLLLTGILRPLMPSLVPGWLTALQDYALLGLPQDLASQRPPDHGFLTNPEMLGVRTRQHYIQHWPVFLLTVSTWLQAQVGGQEGGSDSDGRQEHQEGEEEEEDTELKVLPGGQKKFYLLLGLCLEAFSETTAKPPLTTISICLKSLNSLLSKPVFRGLIFPPKLPEQPYELVRLLHRLIFTRDSVEIHQLCLQALQLILTGAEEHLCRLRALWLTKESQCSQSESHVISTATGAGTGSSSKSVSTLPTSTSMATSFCLPTTSLVDAELYELAEGGHLSGGDDQRPRNGECEGGSGGGAEVSLTTGLRPSRSLVFSALELIFSLLARYRPSVIADMRQWKAFASSQVDGQPAFIQPLVYNAATVPEVHYTGNADIGGLLSAALRCVELLPNLCAPQLLLSSLSNSYRSSDKAALPNPQSTAALTSDGNLLPILLQMAVSIAQDMLLDPSSLQTHRHASLVSDGSSTRPLDQLDLPDLRNWLDTQACAQSTEGQESEISSTGIGGTDQLDSTRLSHLNKLIGWNAQQSEVAQAVVSLLSRLGSHHYPTLTASYRVASEGSAGLATSLPSDSMGGLLQPDSSSSSCNENVAEAHASRRPLDTVSSQWYDLVGSALVTLLQHWRYLHSNSDSKVKEHTPDTSDVCCLSSFVLVCRTVAGCPVAILKAHNLRAKLIDESCRYWHQGLCSGQGEQPSPSQPDSTFTRPVERRICLSAIRLLTSHTNPAVRCSFIKALSPQVFYWLYEVSQQHEKASSERSSLVTVAQQQLLHCLNDAIDLLEYLIDCSEASGRQGLMLIILPMLCSLLCTGPSVDSDNSPLSIGVHMSALRHTVGIASRYPNEFRTIVSALGGDLRGRLETAIKYSATNSRAALGKRVDNSLHGRKTDGRPVIQLRTDFSGFGS